MEPLGPQDRGEDDSLSTRLKGSTGDDDQTLGGFREVTARDLRTQQAAADPRETVMHVRSKVTSYWRGRLFDEFDGQTWYRSSARLVERSEPHQRNYYWQAFFVQSDQHGSWFGGYNPIAMVLPPDLRAKGSLVNGATYSVLSQRPELTARTVGTEPVGQVNTRYLSLPSSSESVRQLAKEVTAGATTPFQKLWLIVSHLRLRHRYDVTAPNQLQLSGSIDEFLVDGSRGTSLDFATATVLLARAAGIPARLAVGYLPGRFDPFSGTHWVRRRDAHAWTEVRFARHGWVAFDSAPRPELEVFTSGKLAAFAGTAYVFQTRVGGGLYQALRSGTSEAAERIAEALEGREGPVGLVAGAIASLAVAWATFSIVRRRLKGRRDPWQYTRLHGEARREIL